MATTIQGVGITISAGGQARLVFPDGVLKPAMWSDVTGEEVPASKIEYPVWAGTNFALAVGATPPVAREEIVFRATTAGTINRFAAILDDTGTNTDIDFVLKKNGSEIMASDLTITHAIGDGVAVEGSLDSASFVAGDRFSIEMVVNSGVDAHGPLAWIEALQTLG